MLHPNETVWNAAAITRSVERLIGNDDVFSEDFLERIYLQTDGASGVQMETTPTSCSVRHYSVPVDIIPLSRETTLPEGPYARDSLGFYEVSKFCEDGNEAFVVATVRDGGSKLR